MRVGCRLRVSLSALVDGCIPCVHAGLSWVLLLAGSCVVAVGTLCTLQEDFSPTCVSMHGGCCACPVLDRYVPASLCCLLRSPTISSLDQIRTIDRKQEVGTLSLGVALLSS